jgi:predicted nucleic acid-binding protein
MSGVFVDSCVLIDLIEKDSVWFDWSLAAFKTARLNHELCINHMVFAEISKTFASVEMTKQFLSDVQIAIEPLNDSMAFLAAQAHMAYRRNRGEQVITLPDFFIGAHALVLGHTLLTRDKNRFATYFPALELIAPIA